MISTRTLARTAGVLYLLVAVCGMFAELNLLNQLVALSIATDGDYASALGPAGSDALAMLFAEMQHDGFLIAQMFFGLWLLPLGYLVVRSGYVPRVLGVLLAVGGVGYLVDLFARFLALGAAERISPFVLAPALVGEVAFVAWLLVRSARVPEQGARVPAAA
jgi:Domain of unknown function (DUF4386)